LVVGTNIGVTKKINNWRMIKMKFRIHYNETYRYMDAEVTSGSYLNIVFDSADEAYTYVAKREKDNPSTTYKVEPIKD